MLGLDIEKLLHPYMEMTNLMIEKLDRVIELLEEIKDQKQL